MSKTGFNSPEHRNQEFNSFLDDKKIGCYFSEIQPNRPSFFILIPETEREQNVGKTSAEISQDDGW